MKIVRKFLLFAGIIVGMVYLTGVMVFSTRFGPQTFVNGVSVTGLTPIEAMMDAVHMTEREIVTFVLPDGTSEQASLKQLQMVRPSDAEISQLSAPGWTWPASLIQPVSYTLEQDVVYKKGADFPAFDFVTAVAQEPVDAYASRREDGSFQFVPAAEGTALDLHVLRDAVVQSVQEGSYQVQVADCYREAAVQLRDDTLLARQGVHQKVVLDLGADVTYELTEADWAVFSREENGWLVVDPVLLDQFVASLAQKYDTYDKPREFVTSTGETVELSVRGDTRCDFPGWKMDQRYLSDMLRVEVLACCDVDVIVPWLSQGKSHEGSDVGSTYLEISLDNQRMWLYQDGEVVVETDVVTGLAGDPARETPIGSFKTTDFYTDHTMTGDYGEIFCKYFIRITEDGVGVHDADWRSSFGGTIYQWDGSHGCINTPPEPTKQIFDILSGLDTWTPIIVW